MEMDAPHPSRKIPADATLQHLEEICRSSAFVSSKRCQEFLRYVIRETLEGRADQIKERNIAHEVFGKGLNFEPGECSLVRVKAGEVRKRLSAFYEAEPESTLRIDLPVGSYVPQIHVESASASSAETTSDSRPTTFNRRRFLWTAGGIAATAGAASLLPYAFRHPSPLERLWKPVFATHAPLVIFLPMLRDVDGQMRDVVGVGPAATVGQAATFLAKHHYPYHLRFGAEMTFSQLREQPSLLLGGFDMEWTLRITSGLRIAPVAFDPLLDRAFVDRQTHQMWRTIRGKNQPLSTDYGMLCRLFDPSCRQIVFLAVGTFTYGTEAAAGLLFDPDLFAQVVQKAPADWEIRNFQAIVRVSVIGTTPSAPQLMATHFW